MKRKRQGRLRASQTAGLFDWNGGCERAEMLILHPLLAHRKEE